MRIVIIEDELMTTEDLSEDLMSIVSDCQIVKTLASVREAINFFENSSEYDLIFSDIQLGDGLSFEIFEKVKIKAPIIFCTAYDEYTIEAFKTNGIDYIFKPFNRDTIAKAIMKFETLKSSLQPDDKVFEELIQRLLPKTRGFTQTLLVYQKDKIIPVKSEEIALFFLQNEMIKVQTFDGRIFHLDKTLEEIEKMNYGNFFRVNRQFLVHRNAIANASQHFNRKLAVNLSVPFTEQIFVSKERSPVFLKWLIEN